MSAENPTVIRDASGLVVGYDNLIYKSQQEEVRGNTKVAAALLEQAGLPPVEYDDK